MNLDLLATVAIGIVCGAIVYAALMILLAKNFDRVMEWFEK